MEKALRNTLYNTVVRCRELLEQDFALRLEGDYGVHADGRMDALRHLLKGRQDKLSTEDLVVHGELGIHDRPLKVSALAERLQLSKDNGAKRMFIPSENGRNMPMPREMCWTSCKTLSSPIR